MNFKPVQIFGFIMSFAYVFFGMLFILTPMLSSIVEEPQNRKIFGIALVAYGLLRVGFFLRKLLKKAPGTKGN